MKAFRLLTLSLCLLALSANVSARGVNDVFKGEGTQLRFQVTKATSNLKVDGEVILTRSPEATGNVVIPAKVKDDEGYFYKVLGIGSRAFADNMNIKTVKFAADATPVAAGEKIFSKSSCTEFTAPKTMTDVPLSTFSESEYMQSVIVEEGNPKFSSENGVAFNKDKTTLLYYPTAKPDADYTLPGTVTSMQKNSFFNVKNLKNITLPEKMTQIQTQAFNNCTNLTNITLPAQLDSLQPAFAYTCDRLANIYIRDNKTITLKNGDKVGSDEGVLMVEKANTTDVTLYAYPPAHGTSYTIPDKVTIIGTNAFASAKIKEITIPTSVKRIERLAFERASNLKNVTFEEAATATEPKLTIGDYAFMGCYRVVNKIDGLNEVELPIRLEYVGKNPFKETPLKVGLTIAGENSNYVTKSGALYTKDGKTLITYPAGINPYKPVDPAVLEGVETIGPAAFYMTYSNGTLEFPSSVKIIGDTAFEKSKIQNLVFAADGVESIGQSSFANISTLKDAEITLPKSLKRIGKIAFKGVMVKDVIFPDDMALEELTDDNPKFEYPGILTEAKISGSVKIGNNIMTGKPMQRTMFAGSTVSSVTIGSNSFNAVGKDSFNGCKNLKSVTFGSPSTITSIGENAFGGCIALTGNDENGFDLPSGVTSIGQNAFSGCTAMTAIDFNGNEVLKIIGPNAFAHSGLLNPVLPNSVDSIGHEAFYHSENMESINIGSGASRVDNNAFSYCKSLQRIDVPATNKTYSSIDGMLTSKDKKTLEVFPAGRMSSAYTMIPQLTTLGDKAFYSCQELTNVTIPATVTTMGDMTFANCKLLNSLSFLGEKLPSFEPVKHLDKGRQTGTFAYDNMMKAKIYVRRNVYNGIKSQSTQNDKDNLTLAKLFGEVHTSFFSFGNKGIVGEGSNYDRGIEYMPTAAASSANQNIGAVGGIGFAGTADAAPAECEGHGTAEGNRNTVIIEDETTAHSPKYLHHTSDNEDFQEGTAKDTKYKVRTILDYAFRDAGATKEIVIVPHMGYIGYDAFKGSNIETIYFVDKNVKADTSYAARLASISYEVPNEHFPFLTTTKIYVRPSWADKYKTSWSAASTDGNNTSNEWMKDNIFSEVPLTFGASSRRATRCYPFATQYGTAADFSAAKANTILPFIPRVNTITSDAVIVKMTSVDNGFVPAYQGVALETVEGGEGSTCTFTIAEDQNTAELSEYSDGKPAVVGGAVEDVTGVDPAGKYLLGSNGHWKKMGASGKVNYFRSFISLGAENAAKALRFTFDDVTGIDNAKVETDDNAPYYTIDGIKVENPSKGIYIHNGKKIIIK